MWLKCSNTKTTTILFAVEVIFLSEETRKPLTPRKRHERHGSCRTAGPSIFFLLFSNLHFRISIINGPLQSMELPSRSTMQHKATHRSTSPCSREIKSENVHKAFICTFRARGRVHVLIRTSNFLTYIHRRSIHTWSKSFWLYIWRRHIL